jgi:hypothetical protein
MKAVALATAFMANTATTKINKLLLLHQVGLLIYINQSKLSPKDNAAIFRLKYEYSYSVRSSVSVALCWSLLLSCNVLTITKRSNIFEFRRQQYGPLATWSSDKTFFTCFSNFEYSNLKILWYIPQSGHAVAQLFEALPYMSKGCGFVSRWYNLNFSLT